MVIFHITTFFPSLMLFALQRPLILFNLRPRELITLKIKSLSENCVCDSQKKD